MEPVRDLELYRGLEQALGASVATALMDRLPQEPVQELATKTDLASTGQALKRDMAALRQELKGDMAELRQELKGDMAELRQEVKGDIAELRQEVKGDIAVLDQRMTGEFALLRQEMNGMKDELTATMRGEMIGAIHTQGRQLAFTLASSLVGLSGLAFAIAQLAA